MPIASAFRFVLRLVGVALLAVISPAMRAALSTAADGFDPNVNGNVYAVAVQPDGKILIAGSFTRIQPNGGTAMHEHINIARLLPDGTNDESAPLFAPKVEGGQINAMVLQPDGGIVIGGKFTTVNGQPRSCAARLKADGSLDLTFDPNLLGSVTGIAGIKPEVTALALQADGKILVGGSFGQVQPNGATAPTSRKGLARFNADGSFDSSLPDLACNGTVLAIAVQPADQQILVGGGFTTIGAQTRNHIARLTTAGVVDGFDPNAANGSVAAIVVQTDGKIVIGGAFTTLQPNGADTASSVQPRLARLLPSGLIDGSFAPLPDGPVTALKLQRDGRILLGGSFSSTLSSSSPYAARLMPDGSTDFGFVPNPNFNVYAFDETADGSVVMVGGFTTVHGNGVNSVLRSHVARVSPNAVLDTDFHPDVNGRLGMLAVQSDGKILVAGSFTSVAGQSHSGLYRLNADGTLDAAFRADTNSNVSVAVPLASGKIMIGGSFTTVNSTRQIYLARLNADGTLDTSFDAAPNGAVSAIAMQGDKVLIGGSFTSLSPHSATDPITAVSFARLLSDGNVDTTFTAQAYQSVNLILVQPSDGKIILGGSFTTVLSNGETTQVARYHLARFSADGVLDKDFSPGLDGVPLAGVVQSDGQIVLVGNFANVGGTGATASTARKNVLRLKTDGKVDDTFDPSPNGLVDTILSRADGSFVIGGYFTSLAPNAGATVYRNYIARLTSAGAVDSFDPGIGQLPGNAVVAIVAAGGSSPTGQLIVGGAFTTLGLNTASPVQRNRLVRINADQTVDTSFNPDLSATPGAAIEALTLQTSGGLLVAGSFSSLNGTGSSNLARFYADGIPDNAFFPNIDSSAGKVHSIAQLPAKGERVATQRPYLAWLEANGVLRSAVAKGTDPKALSDVRAFAVQADGKLLVAAAVTRTANSSVATESADYLIRFNQDGTLDTAFEPLINNTVTALRVQPADQKILIGGLFTSVGTSATPTRNYMARLNPDGSLDSTFNPNFSASVAAIELQPDDGKILVGGAFTYLAPNSATTPTYRNYFARLNADGTVDTGFNPYPDNTVTAMSVLPDGRILTGGYFTTFQPGGTTTTTSTVTTLVTRKYLGVINADGTVGTMDFAMNGPVTRLVKQADGKILVGGTFSLIEGSSRNYIARLNVDTGLTVDTFNPNPNGEVATIAIQADNKILIGGFFTALQPNYNTYDPNNAIPRRYAARLEVDGTVDPTFNPSFDANVGSLYAYPNGLIIAGGLFTSIQPVGSLLVGGEFGHISGLVINNLALFSGDGSVSSTFVPNPNGAVFATQVISDGKVVVGGAFTNIAGADLNRLARFTDGTTLDPTFHPNVDGLVRTLALQADGKLLVGGNFAAIDGAAHAGIARLNVNGSVDSSFNAPALSQVHAIAVQADGRILVASFGGSALIDQLQRLNVDGSVDSTFQPASDGLINAVVVQTDGKIVVGGSFKSIGGKSKSYLARLNADGTLDTSLTAAPSGPVSALTIYPDGKIVFGGAFNAVDGLPRFGLARLAPGSAAPSVFTANPERTTLTWTRSGPGPELSGAEFEGSTDGNTWSSLGLASRLAGTSNWRLTDLSLPADIRYFVRAFGVIAGSSQGSSGLMEARGQIYLSALPVITSATAVNAVNGADFLYAIAASGASNSYAATGLPAGLTINSWTGVISGKPTQSGTFSVTLTVTNSAGSTSTVLTLFVAASGGAGDHAGRISNLSVLAQVTNANPINSGFVIAGSDPEMTQTVLIRAIGPGLSSLGMTGVLASPHLKLYNAKNGVVREADGWGNNTDAAAAAVRLGAMPLQPNSADVAFLVTLRVGAYTFTVGDNSTDSGSVGGYALAEIYDATASVTTASPRLVNISARGIANGSSLVIGGFVVTGDTPKKVLIRGVGPSLSLVGVSGVLSDPKLEIFHTVNGVNTRVASNDNWGTPVTIDAAYPAATGAEIKTAANATGASAFASDTSADSAVLVTLAPGVYSGVVSGVGTATGGTMVEVYEVQ